MAEACVRLMLEQQTRHISGPEELRIVSEHKLCHRCRTTDPNAGTTDRIEQMKTEVRARIEMLAKPFFEEWKSEPRQTVASAGPLAPSEPTEEENPCRPWSL